MSTNTNTAINYSKLPNGNWGISAPRGDIRGGATVTVVKKDGTKKTETVVKLAGQIGNRYQYEIVQTRTGSSQTRAGAPAAASHGTQRRVFRGKRTGCSCGSREDSHGQLIYSSSNCSSCNHDAD